MSALSTYSSVTSSAWSKSITVPISQLAKVLDDGIWFDGSSIQGFARISESDMFLFPDLDTFAIIPWKDGANKTARS